MITQKVIDSLYKTYSKRPSSPDELDIALLFENLIEHHEIEIDDEAHLVINSIPPESPFHRIPLANIHAIVEFEHKIAIVLHSSIIFLNRSDNNSYVHLRAAQRPSLLSRLFSRSDD